MAAGEVDRHGRWKPGWGRFALAPLILAGLAYLTADRGGLVWYSPDTLEVKSQREWTIVGTGIPIYRSWPEYDRPPVFQHLIDEGYVEPLETVDPRWRSMLHWNDAWNDGFGELHHEILRHGDATLAWTENHPDIAAKFWPEAFRLLRSDVREERWKGRRLCRFLGYPYLLYIVSMEEYECHRSEALED